MSSAQPPRQVEIRRHPPPDAYILLTMPVPGVGQAGQ